MVFSLELRLKHNRKFQFPVCHQRIWKTVSLKFARSLSVMVVGFICFETNCLELRYLPDFCFPSAGVTGSCLTPEPVAMWSAIGMRTWVLRPLKQSLPRLMLWGFCLSAFKQLWRKKCFSESLKKKYLYCWNWVSTRKVNAFVST